MGETIKYTETKEECWFLDTSCHFEKLKTWINSEKETNTKDTSSKNRENLAEEIETQNYIKVLNELIDKYSRDIIDWFSDKTNETYKISVLYNSDIKNFRYKTIEDFDLSKLEKEEKELLKKIFIKDNNDSWIIKWDNIDLNNLNTIQKNLLNEIFKTKIKWIWEIYMRNEIKDSQNKFIWKLDKKRLISLFTLSNLILSKNPYIFKWGDNLNNIKYVFYNDMKVSFINDKISYSTERFNNELFFILDWDTVNIIDKVTQTDWRIKDITIWTIKFTNPSDLKIIKEIQKRN